MKSLQLSQKVLFCGRADQEEGWLKTESSSSTIHTTTLLHPFNGLFSRTTWVSWHQKGKPFWILLQREMMGWQWHQLDHMQSFAPPSRQITMPVPHRSVFTSQMPFLPPNQQCQSAEGMYYS